MHCSCNEEGERMAYEKFVIGMKEGVRAYVAGDRIYIIIILILILIFF
jgi:hypothetical protein